MNRNWHWIQSENYEQLEKVAIRMASEKGNGPTLNQQAKG